jgi:uncharacterized SAM-binding protein YcdF (DUF218 family)
MILGAVVLLSLTFLLLAVWVYAYSFVVYPSSSDVAIVLGAAAWGDRPSPVFEERIEHAIGLYRTGSVQAIVFTGGVGEGDQLAESEVAKRYAIRHGVPEERIYIETRSRITYENLAGAKEVLEQQGYTSALIVSDPLHMRRAVTMARGLGIDANPSPTPTSRYKTWRSKAGFLMRETCFFATYLLRRLVTSV